MTEAEVVAFVRAHLSRGPVRLWRNNVGTLQDKQGRYVSFGLCPGSADLIGLKSVTVTPEMVGRRVAVFVALEGKRSARSRITPAQRRFLAMVKAMGGIAGVFTCAADAASILKGDSNDGSEPAAAEAAAQADAPSPVVRA